MKRKSWIPILVLACAVGIPGPPAAAQIMGPPSTGVSGETELIVLLAAGPGAPLAEEVVSNSLQGQALPANLGFGDPVAVRFALEQRSTGALREEIAAAPDSPRARLERYVIFRYPADANIVLIQKMLRLNPDVVSVEENLAVELAATPTDPMFSPANGSTPPNQYQWGSYTLNLPGAWDYNKGHAYAGTVDTGIDAGHPDLVGNFRPHLSHDFGYNDDNVDEGEAQVVNGEPTEPTHAGHGTHVAGILGATANNGIGVAGACWNCSLMIAKASTFGFDGTCPGEGCLVYNTTILTANLAAALTGLVDRGAQVANMSFRAARRNCATSPNVMCDAIAYATQRDVFMVASAGNLPGDIGFPAHDPRVLSAGGIIPDGSFWGECDEEADTPDCPSRSGPDQEVVAPARQVLSTFYRGLPYIPDTCNEAGTGSGYGPCTGTSMSSPYTAGLGALVRSVNPLLSQDNVQTVLRSTASFGFFHDDEMGYGIPNATAAVETVLGRADGAVLPNRLTPLFSFYSDTTTDSFYTTVPQMASAAAASDAYEPTGPFVPGYSAFPGAPAPCPGCREAPGASVYIFTGDRAPFAGAPPLVPLYRLTYFEDAPSVHQDATYTTEAAGITAFTNVGYVLDGIEGYIYQRCTPEPQCIPAGAVRLYRYYSASLDDWAIFPESELAAMQAAGYSEQPGANPWIGYVYPTVDTDGDNLIDGFEGLIGTDAAEADTDCDGASDGNEVLQYPPTDPRSGGQCNQPPVASFTANCGGRFCSFDGTGSTDDSGVVSWAWTFGDGGTATGSTTGHPYATVGTFTVTLTVTDAGGLTHQTSQSVTTTVDNPPFANFYVVCNGYTCAADSESSSDDYGIVNYTWTWGDGQTTSGGSGVSAPSHTYATGGTKTITLVVTDAVGQTASDSHSVTVGQPPTAAFTIDCLGRSCNVNGSASTDDTGIASYTWNWGDESSTTTSGPTANHIFPYDGTFTVNLIVTDLDGFTAGASHTVTVVDYPPTANFYVVCSGLTCTADSEASGDDNGIVNYTWTWGDGATNSGSSIPAPSHTYAAAGTYTIGLVVTDISGQTASDSHSVTVSSGPTASFTITCVVRSCDVNASASTGSIVDYMWDWDDEGLSFGGPFNEHDYGWGGTFTVRLIITDSNGNTAGTTRTVTLP